MAQQTVYLNPGESKQVSFEATPHEARTYQVTVDGLTGSFTAIAPPFDPWVYDFNGDGYIDINERLKATQDHFAGIITRSQLDQVLALPSPPTPPAPPSVEITSITLDKTSFLDWDKFVISITFSNPHDYDVWVRPMFGFGNLIGGEFNVVPALMGLTWENGIEPGGSGAEWVDLGIVAIKGSGMTNYVYDPGGCALVTGEYAYLKVPAKGKATTSKQWWVATYHERRGPGGLLKSGSMFGMIPGGWVPDWYNHCVVGNEYMVEYFAGKEYADDAWEVYEPIPRIWDVCVKVENAFAVIYHPEGIGICHYGLPGAVGKTRRYERVAYEPFVGVAKDLVSVSVDHTDWKDYRGYWHRYRWQRYVGIEDNILVFEDATPPDWW